MAFIYLHQKCDVSFNNCKSAKFDVLNGVKQGAVLSPILFSIYIDDLFSLLKLSGFGCFINGYYYGSMSYADDIVLLSPSVYGLQKLINIAKSYFDTLDLIISINVVDPLKSKTKCLAFGTKVNPLPLKLGLNDILWTDTYTHLGHIFYRDGTMERDTKAKMYSFIGKYHSLCQVLKKKDPQIYIKLINIYFCDFYGSNLWNLYSNSVDKLYTMWNKMIRFVYNLPFDSHRYLLEPISNTSHVKTKLTNRFLKFYETVKNSSKPLINNLFNVQSNDFRSDFGHNVLMICTECQVSNLSLTKIYVPILKELLAIRENNLDSFLTSDETSHLISYISRT